MHHRPAYLCTALRHTTWALVAAALLLAPLAALAVPAVPFNVGPYRLGMTNLEAAKLGMDSCRDDKQDKSKIVCEGATLEPSPPIPPNPGGSPPVFKPTVLVFDRSSKRLREVSVIVLHWGLQDPRNHLLLSHLKIERCPEGWDEPDSFDPTLGHCYALPDMHRSVVARMSQTIVRKTYPAYIEVRARYGHEAGRFAKRRADLQRSAKKEEARRVQLDTFSKGR